MNSRFRPARVSVLTCAVLAAAAGRGYAQPTPVAWWHLSEGPVASAASGSGTVADASGHAHAGTPVGGPIYNPSTVNGNSIALRFNGTSQRVFIPDSPALQLINFTVEAYILIQAYPTNTIGAGVILFRGDDRNGLDPLNFYISHDGRLNLSFDTSVSIRTLVSSPSPLPLNTWTHVAGTLNDATNEVAIYINGTNVMSISTTARPAVVLTGANPGMGIGNVQSDTYDEHFTGLIQDVRLYDAVVAPSLFPPPQCYANCDGSTVSPILNINDFQCFLNRFAVGCT